MGRSIGRHGDSQALSGKSYPWDTNQAWKLSTAGSTCSTKAASSSGMSFSEVPMRLKKSVGGEEDREREGGREGGREERECQRGARGLCSAQCALSLALPPHSPSLLGAMLKARDTTEDTM